MTQIRQTCKTFRASRQGFSLIELMIAVVIMGIMAATAIPSLSAQTTREQARAIRMDMAESLQRIQTMAIADNLRYYLTVYNAGTASMYITHSRWIDYNGDGWVSWWPVVESEVVGSETFDFVQGVISGKHNMTWTFLPCQTNVISGGTQFMFNPDGTVAYYPWGPPCNSVTTRGTSGAVGFVGTGTINGESVTIYVVITPSGEVVTWDNFSES